MAWEKGSLHELETSLQPLDMNDNTLKFAS